jgi:hypothetical protein
MFGLQAGQAFRVGTEGMDFEAFSPQRPGIRLQIFGTLTQDKDLSSASNLGSLLHAVI